MSRSWLFALLALAATVPVSAQLRPSIAVAGGFDVANTTPTLALDVGLRQRSVDQTSFVTAGPAFTYGVGFRALIGLATDAGACAGDDCLPAPVADADRRFGPYLLLTVGPDAAIDVGAGFALEANLRLGLGQLNEGDADDLAADEVAATGTTRGVAVTWGGGVRYALAPRVGVFLHYADASVAVGTVTFQDASGATYDHDPGTIRAQRFELGLRLGI